jgi:hypothetical protein
MRKFNENPLVPIGTCIDIYMYIMYLNHSGCLLTCGALVMSAYKLRQGKSKEMNHWLRARVALQGVTVVALLIGSMQLQKAHRETKVKGAEAEKLRERMEFEKRLLEAEWATQEEERIRSTSKVSRSEKNSSWWSWSRGKGTE